MDDIKELLEQGLTAIIESGKSNGALYNKFISVYTSQFPSRKNPAGCGGCLEDSFYYIQTFYNKQLNPMETTPTKNSSAFHIKGDGTIYSSSLNKHIGNQNLTDDLAFSLLEKSDNYERSFDVIPEDWREKLEFWKKDRDAKRAAKKSGELTDEQKAAKEAEKEAAALAAAEKKKAEAEAKEKAKADAAAAAAEKKNANKSTK